MDSSLRPRASHCKCLQVLQVNFLLSSFLEGAFLELERLLISSNDFSSADICASENALYELARVT